MFESSKLGVSAESVFVELRSEGRSLCFQTSVILEFRIVISVGVAILFVSTLPSVVLAVGWRFRIASLLRRW